jgi:hypothetical protein
MQQAFSVGTPAVPIYAGRREVDDVTLTPVVEDNKTYSVTVQVLDELTGIPSDVEIASFTAGVGTDADLIATGIDLAITALTIAVTSTDNTGTVTVAPDADNQLILTAVDGFTQSYTVTEDAATCFSEITDENNKDYYFVTSEERDQVFVLALAAAVEATNGSYPKQYRVSSSAIETLTAATDPATAGDLLAFIKQGEFTRTAGEWHERSTEIFPELACCVKAGSFPAGTINWKFLQNTATVARHPIKGRRLNTTEQGYIKDRNASWVGEELGLNFMHGGTNATGTSEFTDLVQITDWTKLTMEARILTSLVNSNNGGNPLTMVSSKLSIIKERIESVLMDGVTSGVFAGFEPVIMPTTIRFEDQAARILDQVKFVAYFASKINFTIVDGTLTYKEEIQ